MMHHRNTSRRKTRRRPASNRRSSAFSLMEVLVAMGIFTVGLVAVAAIFPTAISVQRDTVREVDARRIGKNARAMVQAIARTKLDPLVHPAHVDQPQWGMSYTHGPTTALRLGSLKPFIDDPAAGALASANNPTPVMPMIDLPEITNPLGAGTQRLVTDPSLSLFAPMSFHGLFTLDTRSYPKTIPQADRRDYYWYPLLQVKNVTTTPEFSMTLIVMHRDGTDNPPEVRRSNAIFSINGPVIRFGNNKLLGTTTNDEDLDGLPDLIQPGDQILGDDGQTHRVILADADSITVNSDNVGSPSTIYFGVAIDRTTGNVKREGRSPVVWIEDTIPLSINP